MVGFVIAVFYHYIMGSYLKLDYPYNTFLSMPWDKFTDHFTSIQIANDFAPYIQKVGLVPGVYFPFTYIIYFFFSFISENLRLITLLLPFIAVFTYFNYHYLKNKNIDQISLFKNVFIFSFLSYPFLFAIDRANIEVFVFIFICLFIHFYLKKDFIKSIIFLSLAASMKLYPIIFTLLFLKDKKYKEIFYTGLIVFLLTFTSLLLFKGGLISNINGQILGLNYFKHTFAIGNASFEHNSSLFNILKLFIMNFFPRITINSLLSFFSILSIFLFAGITYFLLKRENTLWKQVALIVFTMILLIPVSFNYKLIHLFIPLWLFINSCDKSKYNKYYAILWGLLFIPKGYILPFGTPDVIPLSVFLNPLFMIIFIVLIIMDSGKK